MNIANNKCTEVSLVKGNFYCLTTRGCNQVVYTIKLSVTIGWVVEIQRTYHDPFEVLYNRPHE